MTLRSIVQLRIANALATKPPSLSQLLCLSYTVKSTIYLMALMLVMYVMSCLSCHDWHLCHVVYVISVMSFIHTLVLVTISYCIQISHLHTFVIT
jgi:hypothetical protein